MLTRLVLVGMVAALGITVPTRPEILGWIKTAHSWTASRLAEWDPCEPSQVDAIAVVPMPPRAPIEMNPDVAAAPRPSTVVAGREGRTAVSPREGRPAPAFEPIVVVDWAIGLADELNRAAEGLDIPVLPASDNHRATVEVQGLAGFVRKSTDFGLVLPADTVEQKLATLWFQAEEGPDGTGFPTDSPLSGRRWGAAIPPISCRFSGPSTAERIAPTEDAVTGLADALNRLADRIDPSMWTAAVAVASEWTLAIASAGPRLPSGGDRSTPAFVPIDPVTTMDSDLAHELNRASEGLAVVPDASVGEPCPKPESLVQQGPLPTPRVPVEGVGASHSDPPPDVGLALRLTREAAHAWMNVLTGPAGVRVSAR
jgi:hypothetical protein